MSTMNPRLIGVEGPLAGRTFELTTDETAIGRSPANAIVVPDSGVSRRHCIIRREGTTFELRDLGSMHGTCVNDALAKDRILRHGDRLRIGPAVLVFATEAELPAAADSLVEFDPAQLEAETMFVLAPQESRYLSGVSDGSAVRAERALGTLLRVAAGLNTLHGTEVLARHLLDLSVEAAGAQRGCVLLSERGAEGCGIVAAVNAEDRGMAVSQTVLARTFSENTAVWIRDIESSKAWRASNSLFSQSVRSVLCAPISLPTRVLGALYLDTRGPGFDEDDFHIVTAIAAIASAPLEQARRNEWLERENARLRDEAVGEREMIGESAVMRKLYELIERVAPANTTVLIRGESGTGKELAARALHAGSPRAERPFVAINCAALAESLLESELFGHERGAFTGAIARKLGKIEAADGGTVFLDEIGEMPPALQVKLLRVLQEREIERVGGTRPIRVDIRVIAATNRDLEQAIRAGTFRQDLYYRLNVVTLALPPLRERREDIGVLADHFCSLFATQLKRPVRGLSPEARAALTRHDWPGNVRELQNAIERAVLLASDEWVRREDLPEFVVERATPDSEASAGFHEAVAEAKRQIIRRALEQAGGVVTDAARSLGLNPNYLHRLLNNLDLRPPE